MESTTYSVVSRPEKEADSRIALHRYMSGELEVLRRSIAPRLSVISSSIHPKVDPKGPTRAIFPRYYAAGAASISPQLCYCG
jgi:hypothetical protein